MRAVSYEQTCCFVGDIQRTSLSIDGKLHPFSCKAIYRNDLKSLGRVIDGAMRRFSKCLEKVGIFKFYKSLAHFGEEEPSNDDDTNLGLELLSVQRRKQVFWSKHNFFPRTIFHLFSKK